MAPFFLYRVPGRDLVLLVCWLACHESMFDTKNSFDRIDFLDEFLGEGKKAQLGLGTRKQDDGKQGSRNSRDRLRRSR